MSGSADIGRRTFLGGSAALGVGTVVGLGSGFLPSIAACAAPVKIPAGAGLHSMGGPLVLQMQKDRMLAQAAKELGLEVEIEWQDFQAMLRMLQAVVAGQLKLGMMGTTPTIRNLTTPNPAIPIALAGGGVDYPLQVPPGSPIRNMEGLKGKTVLTVVGSDLHLVLMNMIKAYFGTDDLKKLGITVKNVTALTELYVRQAGIDAHLGIDPGSFDAAQKGELATLTHSNGTTGASYDGPEGKGAGHPLAFFKNTPTYPEGFMVHRIWWSVHQSLLTEQPDAVVAFLVANQRAAALLSKATPDAIAQLVGEHWPGSLESKKRVVEHTIWRRRGWTWITEGDAATLALQSKVTSIFEKELAGARIKEMIAKSADITRKAYERAGRDPAPAAFVDKAAKDVRGLPSWEVAKWTL